MWNKYGGPSTLANRIKSNNIAKLTTETIGDSITTRSPCSYHSLGCWGKVNREVKYLQFDNILNNSCHLALLHGASGRLVDGNFALCKDLKAQGVMLRRLPAQCGITCARKTDVQTH